MNLSYPVFQIHFSFFSIDNNNYNALLFIDNFNFELKNRLHISFETSVRLCECHNLKDIRIYFHLKVCLSNSPWQDVLTGQSALSSVLTSRNHINQQLFLLLLFVYKAQIFVKGQTSHLQQPSVMSRNWTLFSSCHWRLTGVALGPAYSLKIRSLSSSPSLLPNPAAPANWLLALMF